MFRFALGVLLASNSRQVGKGDLVPQLGLLFVTVNGKQVGSEDEMYGPPRLCLPGAFHDMAGLDNAIEFEAAILVDGREGIKVQLAAAEVPDG